MKRAKKGLCLEHSKEVIVPPACATLGSEVLGDLRQLLRAELGLRRLGIQRTADLFGIPLSTAQSWFVTGAVEPVVALLCLLERLPAQKWQEILQRCLREFPTGDHPRLGHNPASKECLTRVLAKHKGLTFLRGGTEEARGFVLTAIGHLFIRMDSLHRVPDGIDLREPTKFVPVQGVDYIRSSLSPQRRQSLVCSLWRELLGSPAPIWILNGPISRLTQGHEKLIEAARRHHIVVANDPELFNLCAIRRMPFRVLEISVTERTKILLHAEFS